MLDKKDEMLKKIYAVKFAMHDLNLFLDSHPENKKAAEMLAHYRKWCDEIVEEYEQKYGDLVTTAADVKAETPWSWVNGPWPWENKEEE